MCRICIIEHLGGILDTLKTQSKSSKRLEIVLEPVNMCTPVAVKQFPDAARNFTFPGQSTQRNRYFTRLIRVIHLIWQNLRAEKTVTSRDLYYQDVLLFQDQRNVVNVLNTLSRLFEVPWDALAVSPAPNGLISGDLRISLQNGDVIDIRRDNGAALIPVQPITRVTALHIPEFILVVEKEAVFSYLQWELPEAIILTGRGFPDRATGRAIKALNTSYPNVPIYGLVDSDPHGILICRNYETGSSTKSAEICTPTQIKYLGVSLLDYSEGLVPSTINDLKLCMSTLQKDWIQTPQYKACKAELQRGLFMAMKSEMNLLDQNQSLRLSQYVRAKIADEQREEHSQAEESSRRSSTLKRYSEATLADNSEIDPELLDLPSKRPKTSSFSFVSS